MCPSRRAGESLARNCSDRAAPASACDFPHTFWTACQTIRHTASLPVASTGFWSPFRAAFPGRGNPRLFAVPRYASPRVATDTNALRCLSASNSDGSGRFGALGSESKQPADTLKPAPSAPEKQDMGIDCPSCHSADIARTRRRGIFDKINAQLGRWPYICRNCRKCFRASLRYPPPRPRPASRAKEQMRQDTSSAGPQLAYRADAERPVAKIVLRAGTHAQMDEMLLAIDRVIAGYERPVRQHSAKERK